MADSELAMHIIAALSNSAVLCVEPPPNINEAWEQQLTENLRNADFIVILLSAAAIHGGEMLKTIIQKAEALSEFSGHYLKYLPVFIDYRRPLEGDFASLFNNLHWGSWNPGEKTQPIIDALLDALNGTPLPIGPDEKKLFLDPNQAINNQLIPPNPRYHDGAINSEADTYIIRDADRRALEEIKRRGETIVIKGPSQMGKSSLLFRLKGQAESMGKQVAYLDFATLSNYDGIEDFFRSFFYMFIDACGKKVDYGRNDNLPLIRDITSQIETLLQDEINQSLVMMIDEADALFNTPYYEDFFSMLRSWHNNRAFTPIWNQLDMVLVTSTERYLYMLDKSRSPFNIGHVCDLQDFTHEQ
ncbi:MAG: AAA-like domain-containing protein, partial [Chloroflexota bacterium]